jgi:hypothetical protein
VKILERFVCASRGHQSLVQTVGHIHERRLVLDWSCSKPFAPVCQAACRMAHHTVVRLDAHTWRSLVPAPRLATRSVRQSDRMGVQPVMGVRRLCHTACASRGAAPRLGLLGHGGLLGRGGRPMATGALAISGPPGPRAAAAHYAYRPGLNCDIAHTCRDADRHASRDRIVTSAHQCTSDRASAL